jgi:hypothetical protein
VSGPDGVVATAELCWARCGADGQLREAILVGGSALECGADLVLRAARPIAYAALSLSGDRAEVSLELPAAAATLELGWTPARVLVNGREWPVNGRRVLELDVAVEPPGPRAGTQA